jgi:thioredoxin-like negative regulator of GroEL
MSDTGGMAGRHDGGGKGSAVARVAGCGGQSGVAMRSLVMLGVVAMLVACTKVEAPAAVASKAAAATAVGIAWLTVSTDAQVDAAFGRARSEGKPVFVYWGAKWCPPCNQLQATLFNRQEFIERSRAFVPVYVDGDSPGAQKLGARFNVRFYPTMVLFDRSGAELTRLPGEVDATQYTEVLTLGMGARRSAKAVLAQALAGGTGLGADDWKLLAFYSWETDQQQLAADQDEAVSVLAQLAATCPPEQADTAMRLLLKSLTLGARKPADSSAVAARSRTRERVLALLADGPQARRHMDVLAYGANELVRGLTEPKTTVRQELVDALETALQRLQADAGLSRADRAVALVARVQLARMDRPAPGALPAALLAEVRALSAAFDRDITDGHERQAVITTLADALEESGLVNESDTLLKANLARSHSPYYLMSGLAANAKKRGDVAAALDWSKQAFEGSVGPSTRLQWGASYLGALVDLAPHEGERIEALARQLIDAAASSPDGFEGRSARSMQRVGARLLLWNRDGRRRDELQRLQHRLDAVCGALPSGGAARGVCAGVLRGSAPGPTA